MFSNTLHLGRLTHSKATLGLSVFYELVWFLDLPIFSQSWEPEAEITSMVRGKRLHRSVLSIFLSLKTDIYRHYRTWRRSWRETMVLCCSYQVRELPLIQGKNQETGEKVPFTFIKCFPQNISVWLESRAERFPLYPEWSNYLVDVVLHILPFRVILHRGRISSQPSIHSQSKVQLNLPRLTADRSPWSHGQYPLSDTKC